MQLAGLLGKEGVLGKLIGGTFCGLNARFNWRSYSGAWLWLLSSLNQTRLILGASYVDNRVFRAKCYFLAATGCVDNTEGQTLQRKRFPV